MAGAASQADAFTLRKDESYWPPQCSTDMRLALPAVSFDNSPMYINFPLRDGELKFPVENPQRRYDKKWSVDYTPKPDNQSTRDALMAARMLRATVKDSLEDKPSRCNYCCDTEFGCNYCIPKGLRVSCPAKVQLSSESPPIEWIGDTGSAQDLISERELVNLHPYESDCPINI